MNNDELITQLAQEATPVKVAPSPFKLFAIWTVSAFIYIIAALYWFGTRSDLMVKLSEPLFLSEIILLTFICLSCALSSALLAYPDNYQKPSLLLIPVIVFALFISILFISWYAHPDAMAPEHGFTCTIHITLMSLLPAAMLFYSVGKLASTHSAKTGLVATLMAFSTGALIARLGEQTDSITHILQWHYLPMFAVALVGIVLGRLLLRW